MTLRYGILILIYSVFPFMVVVMGYAWIRITGFLKTHPSIKSEDDLGEFKRLAKFDMYLALGIITCCGLASFVAMFSLTAGLIKSSDLYGMIPLGFGVGIFGFMLMTQEKRAKTLEIENPKLEEEFRHVVRTWTKKPFPDW